MRTFLLVSFLTPFLHIPLCYWVEWFFVVFFFSKTRCKCIFTPLPKTRLSLQANYTLLMSATTVGRLVREGMQVCTSCMYAHRCTLGTPRGFDAARCWTLFPFTIAECLTLKIVVYNAVLFFYFSLFFLKVCFFFFKYWNALKYFIQVTIFRTLPRCSSLQRPVSAQ